MLGEAWCGEHLGQTDETLAPACSPTELAQPLPNRSLPGARAAPRGTGYLLVPLQVTRMGDAGEALDLSQKL